MKPLAILGKRFEEVKDTFVHTGIQAIYENLQQDDKQEYHVLAPHSSWEILLGQDNIIESIFLYFNEGFGLFHGVSSETSRDQLKNMFGEPHKHGKAQDLPILGLKGAWQLYNFDNYSLHIEHDPTSDTVLQATVMIPDAEP